MHVVQLVRVSTWYCSFSSADRELIPLRLVGHAGDLVARRKDLRMAVAFQAPAMLNGLGPSRPAPISSMRAWQVTQADTLPDVMEWLK